MPGELQHALNYFTNKAHREFRTLPWGLARCADLHPHRGFGRQDIERAERMLAGLGAADGGGR